MGVMKYKFVGQTRPANANENAHKTAGYLYKNKCNLNMNLSGGCGAVTSWIAGECGIAYTPRAPTTSHVNRSATANGKGVRRAGLSGSRGGRKLAGKPTKFHNHNQNGINNSNKGNANTSIKTTTDAPEQSVTKNAIMKCEKS